MDPEHLTFDERQLPPGICTYCGEDSETRDHVPARVFLDHPFPSNLPVVGACEKCNHEFSKDEEYVAYFLEAVLHGTVEPEVMTREKISRGFSKKPLLSRRIESSRRISDDGQVLWQPEEDRIRNVVIKLARGHWVFEMCEPHLAAPISVEVAPLISLSEQQRRQFEDVGRRSGGLWPEIGTRLFTKAAMESSMPDGQTSWITVQAGRYRYWIDHEYREVKIVVSEYLACKVVWGE